MLFRSGKGRSLWGCWPPCVCVCLSVCACAYVCACVLANLAYRTNVTHCLHQPRPTLRHTHTHRQTHTQTPTHTQRNIHTHTETHTHRRTHTTPNRRWCVCYKAKEKWNREILMRETSERANAVSPSEKAGRRSSATSLEKTPRGWDCVHASTPLHVVGPAMTLMYQYLSLLPVQSIGLGSRCLPHNNNTS